MGICRTKVNWILDVDLRSFFDTLSHEWRVRFVEHRIGDARIVRLIRKGLKAGVIEDGQWSASESGTPRGAVVSPLLANIYLHYVFDLWAEQWRGHKAHGTGFTHICGRSPRRGTFLLHRKTRRDRMRARLRALKGELKRRMHNPIPAQGRWLGQVLRGYFAYHAVPTNFARIAAFRYHVTVLWLSTLRRRSQKDRCSWESISRLAAAYLPSPRILHPWPSIRFAVNHPRWEPGA